MKKFFLSHFGIEPVSIGGFIFKLPLTMKSGETNVTLVIHEKDDTVTGIKIQRMGLLYVFDIVKQC